MNSTQLFKAKISHKYNHHDYLDIHTANRLYHSFSVRDKT